MGAQVITFGGQDSHGQDSHGPPQRRSTHNPDEAVPRLKRWAPKTKSGCQTCRNRRVKCDEARPACARCISAKRKCGGYGAATSPLQQASPEPTIRQQPAWPLAPRGHEPTPGERRIFNLLRTLTVSEISGGVKSDFWTKNLLQATYVYPAIWHAALALSAMYQRANSILNAEDPHFAEDYSTFALKQYTTSIGFIIAMKEHSRVSGPEQEMLLTASALYTGICLLRADFTQARTHAINAAKLSMQWRFLEEDLEHKSKEGVIGRANTRQLLRDVYYSFDTINSIPDEISAHFVAPIWHMTDPFASLNDAYYAYLNIHSGWTKIKDWEPEHIGTREASPPPGQMQKRQHALNIWAIRFNAYLNLGTHTPEDSFIIELLRLFHLFEDTFDILMIHRTPEIWVRNAHRWERIVKTAERLLEEDKKREDLRKSKRGFFYYTLSVQQVLRMTGFICRDGGIRRHVIKLLQQWRHCDGLWDNELSWKLVEAKMLKEEKALAAATSGSCDCVPDIFFCLDHRVGLVTIELLEDGRISTKLKTGSEMRNGLPGEETLVELKR